MNSMSKIIKDCYTWINPATTFVLIILSSIVVIMGNLSVYFIVLFINILILFMTSKRESLYKIAQWLVLFALLNIFRKVDLGAASGTLFGLTLLILQVFPIFVLGRILIMSSPSLLLSCFRKLGLPDNFSIGFVIALRFLGEIKPRIREIRNGMKVRGLKLSLFHPVYSFELYFIPLVYKSLNVSETLTSSIISKGVEYEGEKTSYYPLVFRVYDYFFIVFNLFLLVVNIWK